MTGLRVQPRNRHNVLIKRVRTSYTVRGWAPWGVGLEPFCLMRLDQRYVVVKVNPWVGITKPDMHSQIQEWVTKIRGAPLKPPLKGRLLDDDPEAELFG